jgi:hypothetical protein
VDVAQARGFAGGNARAGYGRQNESGENRHDSDEHKKFDKGEGAG